MPIERVSIWIGVLDISQIYLSDCNLVLKCLQEKLEPTLVPGRLYFLSWMSKGTTSYTVWYLYHTHCVHIFSSSFVTVTFCKTKQISCISFFGHPVLLLLLLLPSSVQVQYQFSPIWTEISFKLPDILFDDFSPWQPLHNWCFTRYDNRRLNQKWNSTW